MNRSLEKEMMDMPGQPRTLLEEDLRNLRVMNRRLGNHRNVVRGLERVLGGQRLDRLSLLDVGTGSGDIPALIARWARRRAIAARISALDREPVTVEQAALQTRAFPEITLVRGDGMTPPFRPASFDIVLASQVLHHFSEDNIPALLRAWSKVARRAVIVSDLVRHPLAYHGVRLLTRCFTRNPMTRTDAPLSVARSFTIAEWRALLLRADIGPFELSLTLPFRVLAVVSLGH